jgi:hypothetical protein
VEQAEDPEKLASERWGLGPVGAWVNKVQFEKKMGKQSPPFETDASDFTAFVYGGNAENLNYGTEKSMGPTRAFRQALLSGKNGKLEPEELKVMNKELYTMAMTYPRDLVWKLSPCLGVSAVIARFLPELEDLTGCGVIIMALIEPDFRPMGCDNNVALIYAATPSNKAHKKLAQADVLCALWGIGYNVTQAIREYNKLADGEIPLRDPPAKERALFVRAAIESQLAIRQAVDVMCQDDRAWGLEGWINTDVLMNLGRIVGARVNNKADLIDALAKSKIIETTKFQDGRSFVRIDGVKYPTKAEKEFEPVQQEEEQQEDPATAAAKATQAQLAAAAAAANAQVAMAKAQAAAAAAGLPVPQMTIPGQSLPGPLSGQGVPNMQPPGFGTLPPMMTPPNSAPPGHNTAINPTGRTSCGIIPPFMQGMNTRGPRVDTTIVPELTTRARGFKAAPLSDDMGNALEPPKKKARPQDDIAAKLFAEGKMDQANICWNYARGHCAKGAECRWGHVEGINGGQGFGAGNPTPGQTCASSFAMPASLGGNEVFAGNVDPLEHEVYSSKPPSSNAMVRVTGLIDRPAFNNRIATCKSFDSSSSRWEVQLEDGSILRLQEKNMKVIEKAGSLVSNASSKLAAGERVRITGLTSKPLYNNRAALCQSYDKGTKNWVVLIEDGSKMSIPESNLMPY